MAEPPPGDPRRTLAAMLQAAWQERGAASQALLPLSWLYGAAVSARRRLHDRGTWPTHRLPVPVIVVGNVVAGGAGKTPAVIAVCAILRRAGRVPGIVSRGYGRRIDDIVEVEVEVSEGGSTDPARAGDEPLLLARRTGAPVFVGADRVGAAHALLQRRHDVDVIVADDGLQHLGLGRDVEIVVFDERGVGNGRLLPAGPLREPAFVATAARDASAGAAAGDRPAPRRIVLYNASAPTTALPGYVSARSLAGASSLEDWRRGEAPSRDALLALRGRRIVAAAGTARPERFFALLRDEGLDIAALPLPDHHDYAVLPWPSTAGDVIVTEKDAVKLDPGRRLGARIWVATLDFAPEPAFADALLDALAPPADESLADPADPHGNPSP